MTRSRPMGAPPAEKQAPTEPRTRSRRPGAVVRAVRAMLWAFIVVWMMFAIWLVFFGMPCTAVGAAVFGMAFMPPVRLDLRTAAYRGLILVAVGVGVLAWGHVSLLEFQDSVDQLSEQIRREGPDSLSFEQRAGIFGLNAVMGMGGYVAGYPEAGKETLLLSVPGPAVRHWGSDFALRSPRVRRAVGSMVAEADAADGDSVQLSPVSVSWPQYAFGQDSLRVALALNSPLEITGTASRVDDRWRLDLVGSARVEYPKRGRVSLLGNVHGKEIALEEGLFGALQEVAWLYPYTARWSWTVYSDDPRLTSPRPEISWREGMVMTLSGFLRELSRRWG